MKIIGEKMTEDAFRSGIVPKSDQLNVDDVMHGTITATITHVRRVDNPDQPWLVYIEGFNRPWKPCKTMRRMLLSAFGLTEDGWVGERITLYNDSPVKFGKDTTGGIRVSEMSTLPNPHPFRVMTSRNKYASITVRLIPKEPAALSEEHELFIGTAGKELAAAESLKALERYGDVLKNQPKAVQDALRPIYATRMKELKERGEA